MFAATGQNPPSVVQGVGDTTCNRKQLAHSGVRAVAARRSPLDSVRLPGLVAGLQQGLDQSGLSYNERTKDLISGIHGNNWMVRGVKTSR